MRTHAEKVVFHSIEFIYRVLVCVWSLWLRAMPFVWVILHASSIAGEGSRIPKTSLLFWSHSCGSRAKAAWLGCRAHLSFIVGTTRGTAPVISVSHFHLQQYT